VNASIKIACTRAARIGLVGSLQGAIRCSVFVPQALYRANQRYACTYRFEEDKWGRWKETFIGLDLDMYRPAQDLAEFP